MFNNIFENKKVLVTGDTGFKGSWLTIWLLKLGADVYGISKDIPTTPSMFESLGIKERVTHYDLDILKLDELSKKVLEIQPDFVFHLAAQALVSISYENPVDTIATNALGTAHVLECLRRMKHNCTAVMITSDKCYDNVEWEWGYKETDRLGGKDIYSGSKAAAEVIIYSYFHSYFNMTSSRIRIASTRAGNVIGGGDWAKDRIVPDCVRAWSKNKAVDIRKPDATRPWQHVLEPLSGYLHLGASLFQDNRCHGESFNFGPSFHQNYPVRDLISALAKNWSGVRWNDLSQQEDKMHEAGLLKLNCDKALAHLDWMPTLQFDQTVSMTADWYKQFYNGEAMYATTMKQIEEYVNIAASQNLAWTQS